jgi:hypothetical protein
MPRNKPDEISNDRMEAGPVDTVAGLYKPTARECALLLLRLIEVKEKERQREVSRLRIAEISLKRLWGRRRISPEFAEEVAEWLSGADFTLFFAGTTYAVVKTSVVESWPRTTSRRLSVDLLEVARGAYKFSDLERLMPAPSQEEGEDEERDSRPGRV